MIELVLICALCTSQDSAVPRMVAANMTWQEKRRLRHLREGRYCSSHFDGKRSVEYETPEFKKSCDDQMKRFKQLYKGRV